ncbi:MAG: type II secretion system protein, partial [bacterium]|nr:type II secretion system protein [bacterium]
MPHFSKDKKGFTLVEILIVIMIFGIMASMAVSTYMNATGSFTFLSGYKTIMSSVRTARSYAITNREEGGELPERYGVFFEANKVTLFADLGETPFVFDKP